MLVPGRPLRRPRGAARSGRRSEGALRPGAVVRLDLSAVRFIDSTALAELLRSRTALLAGGGQLVLQPVSDPVRVILELTGLDEVFAAPTARAGSELSRR